MTLTSHTQKFSIGAITTFVEIDFTHVRLYSTLGPDIVRFCNSVSDDGTTKRSFNGNTWDFVDFEFSKVESDITGAIPEPELQVHANYQPLRDAFIVFDDLRNAVVTRYRYFHNDNSFVKDKYFIWKIEKFDHEECQIKLSVARGMDDANSTATRVLPSGLCIRKYRTWNSTTNAFEYTAVKDGGCPWGQWPVPNEGSKGTPYYDLHNNSVGTGSQDRCSKTYAACIKRFDPSGTGQQTIPITAVLRTYSSASGSGCS
jgi:phage-related protein